jgi:selenocysteine lyase/cysteine desulfurase
VLALGASIDLLLETGIDRVWAAVEAVTDHLCRRLPEKGYRVFSPRGRAEKSGIVSFMPGEGKPDAKRVAADLEKQGIIAAVREGRLRASPHFYNTIEQMDRLIEALP